MQSLKCLPPEMPTCLVAEILEFSHYSLDLPALCQENTGREQIGHSSLKVVPLAMLWEKSTEFVLLS